MLELPNVTLLTVDSKDFGRSAPCLINSMAEIKFGAVKYFTRFSENIKGVETIILNPPVRDWMEYNHFIVKRLEEYINTDFVLIVQYDGYVVNPEAWQPEFLHYDYIGAPWLEGIVGNGGFSLRSKKLLKFIRNCKDIKDIYPEDIGLCIKYRKLLEDNGFKFAPRDLADIFSVEGKPYHGQFGWHMCGSIKPPRRKPLDLEKIKNSTSIFL
jgi:hypothetical protein